MKKLSLAAAFAISTIVAQDVPPELPSLKRVYVDRLVGNETADRIREVLVASLHNSKLFIITEDVERADATLKGTADEQVYTDQYQSSDGADMHVGVGTGTRTIRTTGVGARGIAVGVGDNESASIHEHKHEAMASVRLVSRAGDVIWSTTQESEGGKFKGAGADVAEKVTKRLIEDMAKAKQTGSAEARHEP
jgi:hypothetical protein